MPAWKKQQPVSHINVTPFVDVLLVLLVIFMITAPIVHQMVQIELPQDSYNQDGSSLNKSMRVIVNAQGVVYLNDSKKGLRLDNPQALLTLEKELSEWKRRQKPPWFVDLEADQKLSYGNLVPVISRLKEQGVSLNLIIQPDS